MTAPTTSAPASREGTAPAPWLPDARRPGLRDVVAGTFSGTPGRLRLYGAVTIVACLLFGVLAFFAAGQLHTDISNTRNDAAQLVRVQTIRTSLVKADASATNAFLVGGLEPADVRAAYTDGIATAARTIAAAASANPGDAAALQRVNRVLANYAGLIEAARANNRQGFPIGAAYLRQASNSIQQDALPPLAALVAVEQQRVDDSNRTADWLPTLLLVVMVVALGTLIVFQFWMALKSRRILNVSMLVATGVVILVGLVGIGVTAWARSRSQDARDGAYKQTVALATARINAFDAKSAEALTLINRGSGQPFEDRFKAVSKTARSALAGLPASSANREQARSVAAFQQYLAAHTQVRKLDDGGNWDQAVALATGSGAANQDFGKFETVSDSALASQASSLSDKLDSARRPLTATAWLLLVAGLVAAVATWRGVNRRLREYR
jgi:hypothetical protein